MSLSIPVLKKYLSSLIQQYLALVALITVIPSLTVSLVKMLIPQKDRLER